MADASRGAAHADVLVPDLDTRAGLSVARSLGRSGCTVSIATRDGRASGFRTRYAASRVVLPDPAVDFAAHSAALIEWLRMHPADAVIPVIDSSVEALHRHREDLCRVTALALGSSEAIEIAVSKERTLEVARELGVPVPRGFVVSDHAELDSAVGEVGAPCVLKPVTSWRALGVGGERVAPLYVTSAGDASRIGANLVRPGAPVLVQELAGGMRETIKLFRDKGKTLVRLAMVVDRAWPPLGGSSVMRRTTDLPTDTLAHAERLVAEIGLDGYSEVEFRRNAAGRPLLMEVNPRLSQSVELAIRAGVDFPRMQLEWARGGVIPVPPAPAVGLRVGWLAGDFRLLVGALVGSPQPRPRVAGTARAIVSDYLVHRARFEGFDIHDPKPMLGAVGFALRTLVGHRQI